MLITLSHYNSYKFQIILKDNKRLLYLPKKRKIDLKKLVFNIMVRHSSIFHFDKNKYNQINGRE